MARVVSWSVVGHRLWHGHWHVTVGQPKLSWGRGYKAQDFFFFFLHAFANLPLPHTVVAHQCLTVALMPLLMPLLCPPLAWVEQGFIHMYARALCHQLRTIRAV
jgi:hypothetical protein